MSENGSNWERDVITKLAGEALAEQRRGRRWGIAFKILTFAYLFILLFVAIGWIGQSEVMQPGEHTGVVEVSGVISAGSAANADDVVAGLQEAFEADNDVLDGSGE